MLCCLNVISGQFFYSCFDEFSGIYAGLVRLRIMGGMVRKGAFTKEGNGCCVRLCWNALLRMFTNMILGLVDRIGA